MTHGRVERHRGFTLLEVMITVAIVGVILVVAAPSFKRYIETQRLKSIASELLVDLQFARTEAVSRGRAVGIRFTNGSGDPMSCYTIAHFSGPACEALAGTAMANCDCRSGAGSACTPGNWTEIKTVSVPKSRDVQITWSAAYAPAGADAVAFDPTSGNMTYCNSNWVAASVDAVTIDITGSSPGNKLQTEIVQTGRPKNCVPSGGSVPGVPSC